MTKNSRTGEILPKMLAKALSDVSIMIIKGKYLAEFSFRYDGSLKFHPDRRWGFFPSVSLGWRLSEEAFMKRFSNLDNLKIRGSYGILGNDAVGGWQWLTNYSFGDAYIFNQAPTNQL